MVKLDKKSGVGHLNCKICNQQFQCAVNYLSAAVDVYSDWVDACDAVAKIDSEQKEQSQTATRSFGKGGSASFQGTSFKRGDENHDRRNIDQRVTSGSNYTSLHTKIDDDDY